MFRKNDFSIYCLTIDVEWACDAVIDDLRQLLDERNLKATFFCTHQGINVGDHERGIHPNFRPDGDCLKALAKKNNNQIPANQKIIYQHVLEWFMAFAPESKGVRAHSLFYDSQLLSLYKDHGLQYDSSYQIPLAHNLNPFWKECNIVELPIYYNDYFDIKFGATQFDLAVLQLDQPGMKVFNFHPNILYLNADTEKFYLSTKEYYHNPERLLSHRRKGAGAREIFIQLLDKLTRQSDRVLTLSQANNAWRQKEGYPWK